MWAQLKVLMHVFMVIYKMATNTNFLAFTMKSFLAFTMDYGHHSFQSNFPQETKFWKFFGSHLRENPLVRSSYVILLVKGFFFPPYGVLPSGILVLLGQSSFMRL